MIKPHSIRTRIFAGFAVVALLLSVELSVALSGLSRIRGLRHRLAEVLQPRVHAAEAVERAFLYRAIAFRNLLASDAERRREAYERAVLVSDAELKHLRDVSTDVETRALAGRIEARLPAFEATRDRLLELSRAGASRDVLIDAESTLSRAREDLLAEVREYAAYHDGQLQALRADANAAQEWVKDALLASAALVLAVLLVTAILTHQAVRRPAVALVQASRALEGGDYAPALAVAREARAGGDELDQLAGAFGRMAVVLRRREERLAADGRVSAALASSLDLPRVAERTLAEVIGFTGAELAAVYVLDRGADRLRRIAGHACDAASAELAPDGIVGQALAERRVVAVHDIPASAPFTIRLGIDALPPRAVVAAPFDAGADGTGVLLVGAVRELPDDAIPFAERAAAQLGVAARNVSAHARVTDLATELEASNAELHGKNEELRAQGDALQAQSEALQAQAEELQAQTEELQAQAEELQAQSDEIHRQNEELRGARDEMDRRARALEDVDRRKGEFLAQLGHELRNPLAAIANAAHLIEAGAPGGRVQQHVSIVSRQARQLRRLVDDLLDVSRINHGKIELRVEAVDLRRVVENAIEAARPAIESKGHRLSVSLPATPLGTRADPARLQQVVSNLVHNAAKYTPHGGLIEISAERHEGHVHVKVRDSGIGIAPDLLPRIFEPFTQGEHSDKQGLGLGLALVHRLVRMHGGEVEARSDGPDRGSEFLVRLAADQEHAQPGRRSPRRPTAPPRPLRVMVVDDNEDLAETMCEMLQSFGHQVAVANEPEPALERIVSDPPDVALLDIGLPRMDGHQLAREIRTQLPDAPLRLIAVTGYAQPEDRTRAHEAGFDLHLAKPLDPEELKAVLAKIAEDLPARSRRAAKETGLHVV
jgi:signal transduction histidine kinase/CheY-like chemotaxis protein/CHASE3 domain sensor protein